MARESLEKKSQRGKEIFRRLKIDFPHPETALLHQNPFELLIATMLSAQCTDARVNMVTPKLFQEGPTPEAMANLGAKRIETLIKSINFFRNKAQNIFKTSKKIIEDFAGKVPGSLDDLVTLPGVGRKTANVVLGNAFETPGMVVDTHVLRLSNRLGLQREMSPVKAESKLEKIFPKEQWVELAHLFILHGRKTCKALSPQCQRCILVDLCPSAFKAAVSWKS